MENAPVFIDYYKDNIREISSKTTFRIHGEVIEDLLDGLPCWMVTDNITEILKESNSYSMDTNSNDRDFLRFIDKELNNNKLLIFAQDVGTEDHYFCTIGYYGYVIIIEYGNNRCLVSDIKSIPEFLIEIDDIVSGIIPDRFYGVIDKHVLQVTSYYRKSMTIKTIYDYIRS